MVIVILFFRSDYYKPPDNAYGTLLSNGSWNGLVAMLLEEEVETSNGDFFWTASRAEVIDYIAPIIWFK